MEGGLYKGLKVSIKVHRPRKNPAYATDKTIHSLGTSFQAKTLQHNAFWYVLIL